MFLFVPFFLKYFSNIFFLLLLRGDIGRRKCRGSGSLEQDGPLCIVAMEEEEQARLMHQYRLGK